MPEEQVSREGTSLFRLYSICGLTGDDSVPAESVDVSKLPLPFLFPGSPETRTESDARKAVSILNNTPQDEIEAFKRIWFINRNEADQKALDLIRTRHWNEAYRIWSKRKHGQAGNALHNAAVLTRRMSVALRPDHPDFLEWSARALQATLELKAQAPSHPLAEERPIIDRLISLARQAAAADEPKKLGAVLRVFKRSGLPSDQLKQIEREFLADEVDRLRFHCAQVRQSLVDIMRTRPDTPQERLEEIENDIRNEIEGTLSWILEAGLPGGSFTRRACREVTSLYRSLSRAWGSLADDPAKQRKALERALQLAPDSLRDELALELEAIPLEAASNAGTQPTADIPSAPVPKTYQWLGTGLELSYDNTHAGGYQDANYIFTLFWLPLVTLARYRLFIDADGNIKNAYSLPLTTSQLIGRTLVLALIILLPLQLVFNTFQNNLWQDNDPELESAALRAKIDVLLQRTRKTAQEASRVRAKIQRVQEQLTALQEQIKDNDVNSPLSPPELTQKIQRLKHQLNLETAHVKKLDAKRRQDIIKLRRLQNALDELSP